MGDDITIGVTEIVNNIEVTAQPNDQIIDISVVDNTDEVTLNITPTVIEINVNKGSSYAKWGVIVGTLSDQEDLQDALDLKADLVDGKVPSSQLPSYVDDVIEVADYAALPVSGETGKIYVTLDSGFIYRWTGTIYVRIADEAPTWGAIVGTLSDQTDLQSALNSKEDDIAAGTTAQYWRGDKSWQTLDKTAVGLSNVDNTSDLNKPISTATQTALDLKANDNNVVKLTGNQSVAGEKTFTNLAKFTNSTGLFAIEIDTTATDALVVKDGGTTKLQIGRNGEILGKKYKVDGGFSSQFLKANGDLDSNTYALDSSVVKVTTNQNIRGVKSFLGNQTGTTLRLVLADYFDDGFITSDNGMLRLLNGSTELFNLASNGNVTANSFIKSGGLSTQFLKADGSVDSSTYALDNAVVKLTGNQTIAGAKTFSNGIVSNNTSTGDGLLINNSGARALNILNTAGSSFGLLINNDNLTSVNTITTQKQGSTVFRVTDSGGGYFAGNVGIGIPSPATKFEVSGNSGTYNGNSAVANFYSGTTSAVIQVAGTSTSNWVGLDGNGDAYIWANGGSQNYRFAAGGSERMRITSSGNVGIGNGANVNSRLHVDGQDIYLTGALDNRIRFSNFGFTGNSMGAAIGYAYRTANTQESGSLVFYTNPNTTGTPSLTERMRITSSGAVEIATYIKTGTMFFGTDCITIRNSSDTANLWSINRGAGDGSENWNFYNFARNSIDFSLNASNGRVYIPSVYSVTTGAGANVTVESSGLLVRSTSSLKYKKNVENYEKGLEQIMQMRPVTYNSINESEEGVQYAGLIAEEIHDLGLTEFVQYAEDGTPDALAYSNMVSLLVKGIQELKQEIEILKNK